MNKYIAEFIGTFALIFFACGTAIFMLNEVGLLGVALAFGLTVTGMAYGIGPISGAHLNPAVSLGVLVAGRMSIADFVGYVIAQIAGAIAACAVMYTILISGDGVDATGGFASNSPGAWGVTGALIFEVVATFLFVTVILGSTQPGVDASFAGIAIGLTLAVVHLMGISISGVGVNPARSIGPALFHTEALADLWIYIVAPLVGGAAAGALHVAGVTKA